MHSSHARNRRAFTLIELLAVLVVLTVLVAVAIPSLARLARTRGNAAARMILKDVTSARERAVASGRRTWIVFNTPSSSYTMLMESAASPGRAGATAVTDGYTGKAFSRTLNTGDFGGISLTSAVFDGASEIGFDWVGKPLNSSESSLVSSGQVVLSDASQITVNAATGYVSRP